MGISWSIHPWIAIFLDMQPSKSVRPLAQVQPVEMRAIEDHFIAKTIWKNEPGHRYLPKEPTPMDDLVLDDHTGRQVFEFDWA
jgi:hypothetical protein